jgi:RND superfamily putative drug exporter
VGTTLSLGPLFVTLIVRSFMAPSIAALRGRWFWWPQRVRPCATIALEDDDAVTTEFPETSA